METVYVLGGGAGEGKSQPQLFSVYTFKLNIIFLCIVKFSDL